MVKFMALPRTPRIQALRAAFLFYVHNNILMASWKYNPNGAIMQPIVTCPHEFSLNGENGQVYHLKFVIDEQDGTVRCLIHNENLALETIKITPAKES
jgi:hypothetical protein